MKDPGTLDSEILQPGPELDALIAERWMGWHTFTATTPEWRGELFSKGTQCVLFISAPIELRLYDGYKFLSTWSPSINPAHAGEARRKAKGFDLHTFNYPCPRHVSCTLQTKDELPPPGLGFTGRCKFAETDGDKGAAEALATCRAIVVALKAAEPEEK